jgi:threonine dehydratase
MPSSRSPHSEAWPAEAFAYERLEAARRASVDVARWTPMLTAMSLSERCGGVVALKAENLQRTGSFKLRGALNKLRALPPATAGVTAGSAGNHAQALAYAARAMGLACEVFMPVDASVSKVLAVEAFGAVVHQQGDSVDACVQLAREKAEQEDLAFVHPFDDLDVIAGQAGVGLELLRDVEDLTKVVVPIGGGGLASGVALAIKSRRADVEIVGVQAEACAPFPGSMAGAPQAIQRPVQTIADGIAIKRPGDVTLPIVRTLVGEVVTVSEHEIAEAMVLLLERSKLMVEGAGAGSVAALLSGAVTPAPRGTTVAILSGGNVDAGLIAAIAARHETAAGRRVRLFTRVSDVPGGLAGLLTTVAEARANVLGVDHVRDGVALRPRETGVELTAETRGAEHTRALLEALRQAGYDVAELG